MAELLENKLDREAKTKSINLKDKSIPSDSSNSLLAKIVSRKNVSKDDEDLIFAATYGQLPSLLSLLKKGVSPYCVGSKSRLPLHDACVGGHDKCVEAILSHMTDVEARDIDGMTATHLAAVNGEVKCLKLLVEKEADLVARDNKGRQPAHLAAMRNHFKVLRFLFDNSVDLDSQCDVGKSPIHYAAQYGCLESVVCLVERDCDMTMGDKSGYLPAHYAAHYRKLDCLRFLVKQGTSLEAKSTEGKTPAHTAALYGSVDVLHWLFEQGGNPNLQDCHGNTPGHYATEGGKADCFNCFLQHGGRLDIENIKGDTTLDTARRFGHPLLMEQAVKNEITCEQCFQQYKKLQWFKANPPANVVNNITNIKSKAYMSPLPPLQKPSSQLQRNVLKRESKEQNRIIKTKLPNRDLAAQYFGEHLDPNQIFQFHI